MVLGPCAGKVLFTNVASGGIMGKSASKHPHSLATKDEAGRHCSLPRTERISWESPGGFR